MKLVLWLLLVSGSFSLYPSGHNPVLSSFTNAKLFSDYTFSFTLETTLPAGGQLQVTFPEQFETNLGVLGTPSCQPQFCLLSSKTITFTFDEELKTQTTYSATVRNIVNPSNPGGTGNFQLATIWKSYVFDENKGFGAIAVTQEPKPILSASVESTVTKVAGQQTKYKFSFKFTQTIPAGTWIRFTFPQSGYDIGLVCPSDNFWGRLSCKIEDTQLSLHGLKQDLVMGTQYSLEATLNNPPWKGYTGNFIFEVFREDTYHLYARNTNVQGLTIEPGSLNVDLQPLDPTIEISREKVMLYKLTFTNQNEIPETGKVVVEFPSNFHIEGDYFYELQQGFQSIANLASDYDIPNRVLTVSNFAKVNPSTEFAVTLQLKNPSTSGETPALEVKTLTGSDLIIDQGSSSTKVSSTKAPLVRTDDSMVADGSVSTITFKITPGTTVPNSGYVSVKLAGDFTSAGLVCQLKPYGGSQNSAASCSLDSGLIWAELFAAFAGSQESSLILDITFPKTSGYYTFDIVTYDSSKSTLESGSGNFYLNPPSFSAVSIVPVHTTVNLEDVLVFQVTSDFDLEGGVNFFRVSLPTQATGNDLFDLGLGFSLQKEDSVPCLGTSGITSLTCKVETMPTVASEGTPIVIKVSDFSKVSASTPFEFHLAGIKYLKTTNTASVTFTSYKVENHSEKQVQSSTVTLPTATSDPGATVSGNSLTLTPTEVQQDSSLSLSFTATSPNTGGYILIPITTSGNYCGNVNCLVESSPATCYCYSNTVLILTSSLPSGTVNIQIQNLINPEFETSSDTLELYYVQGQTLQEKITYSSNIPAVTLGFLSNLKVNSDKTCAGCPSVKYSFEFKTNHKVPQGGSVLVTFPLGAFEFHKSDPVPYCSDFVGFNAQCTAYSNTLTLVSPEEVNSETLVMFSLKGVKNPSALGSIGNIQVDTLSKQNFKIDTATASGPSLDSNWNSELITYCKLEITPTNAQAYAEYHFSFTPTSQVPQGSLIQVEFPIQEFGALSNPSDCRVSGGIYAFESCWVSGSTVKLKTSHDYISGNIEVYIYNILNFAEGTSGEIFLKVYYDGVLLQETSAVYAQTSSEASSVAINSINFYPKNEGEEATYEFHFTPSLDFDKDTFLTVTFPETYDKHLGNSIECSSEGLSGYLKCEVTKDWTLTVKGHSYYKACTSCKVSLFVYGIINPNFKSTSNTGGFKLGTLKDHRYTQYNQNAGELDIDQAPNLLQFYNLTVANQHARSLNSFTLNFTTEDSVPSSQDNGAIWVEFPSEFVLEGSKVVCESDWRLGTCFVERNYVKLPNSGSEVAGNFIITLKEVPNPLAEVESSSINVKVYDGYKQKLIASSYSNMNPNRLTYSYPGPVIYINNFELFYLEMGTFSQEIPVTLDYPCSLNLTLTPYSQGFSFVPQEVTLVTGSMLNSFKVGAPEGIQDKEYIITWSIAGETLPTHYTPILKSFFVVTQQRDLKVHLEEVGEVPYGGSSLPVRVWLDAAPYEQLDIFLQPAHKEIQVSPQKLEFPRGVHEKFFTVFAEEGTFYSETNIQFTASDSRIYALEKSSLVVKLVTDNGELPRLAVSRKSLGKSYAEVLVSGNKECKLYYALALRGTKTPSFEELLRGGPPKHKTTQTTYGESFLGTSKVSTLRFDNLSAQTRYTVFLAALDKKGNRSQTVKAVDFSTSNRYLAAETSLWFSQKELTPTEKELAKSCVALVLGLNPWQVIEKSSETQDLTTKLNLYIVDNPGSDDYPPPVEMVSTLNSQELASRLNNFNQQVPGSQVEVEPCKFKQPPTLLGTSIYNRIVFSAELEKPGYIHSVAIKEDLDPGVPYSSQVALGLDASNLPALHQQAESPATITFEDLDSDSHYNVYVVCSNKYPGFPDLNEEVATINWKTDTRPAPTLLDINSAYSFCMSCLSLLLMT